MAITYNPPNGAEGFSDLAVKAMSNYAVFTAHKNLAKLQLFTHTFTELNGRPGETIAVPVYDLSPGGDFDPTTNNYGTNANETGGLLVTLNKHYVKSVGITDADLAFTGINWARDTAGALAERITRDMNEYVFETVLAGDSETSAGVLSNAVSAASYLPAVDANFSAYNFAKLYAVAEGKDIPVDKSILVLSPDHFAQILSLVDYKMVGTGTYIENGVLPGMFGFKGIIASNFLPGAGTANPWQGAIVLDEAIGIASKYLAPMTAGAYPQAWSATDDNGFTIGFRRYMDLASGRNNFAVEALFGAKVLQPKKIIPFLTTIGG